MRKYLKASVEILMIFMFFGCSTMMYGDKAWLVQWEQHLKNGNCSEAFNGMAKNGNTLNPGERAALIGAIYHDCKKDYPTATKYLTLAARYGNVTSRELLIREGNPVPPADLAQSNYRGSSSRAESDAGLGLYLFDAAIKGWNAGTQRANNQVDCTSIALGRDMVRTSCR